MLRGHLKGKRRETPHVVIKANIKFWEKFRVAVAVFLVDIQSGQDALKLISHLIMVRLVQIPQNDQMVVQYKAKMIRIR